MLTEISEILESYQKSGWVLEPDAKRIFKLSGLDVPAHIWAKSDGEALNFAKTTGYPVVAKLVSPKALHKSDMGGVEVGINSDGELKDVFNRFSLFEEFKGVLVEEMVSGLELIIGVKMDYQFGPVVLMGMGGTGVEIYQDAVFRMAPLKENDVISMIRRLKARRLIEGFRGQSPINIEALTLTMLNFSKLAMGLGDLIESADLNPVMCSSNGCTIADARIILKKKD